MLAAGLRATVQDAGRDRHERSGIPPSGPADPLAFAAACSLAGADAAIEVAGGEFVFSCDDARVVAVTGRGAELRVRTRLAGWQSAFVRGGEEVRVRTRARYAYLAVSGGFALEPVLGSRSTYLFGSLGPIPRALLVGDELPLRAAPRPFPSAGRRVVPPEYEGAVIAVAGPHAGRFAPDALRTFFGAAFTVAEETDRMGTRLAGAPIDAPRGELLSCGMVVGAVQLPRGGTPIVLGPDHGTTGGYLVIATVARAHLGLIAQRAAGEEVRFREATAQAAAALYREVSRPIA